MSSKNHFWKFWLVGLRVVAKPLEIEAFQEVHCQFYEQIEAFWEIMVGEPESGVQNPWKQKHFRKFGANFMTREKLFGKFWVVRLTVACKTPGNRSILGSLVQILWVDRSILGSLLWRARQWRAKFYSQAEVFWEVWVGEARSVVESLGNRRSLGTQVSILFLGRSILGIFGQ